MQKTINFTSDGSCCGGNWILANNIKLAFLTVLACFFDTLSSTQVPSQSAVIAKPFFKSNNPEFTHTEVMELTIPWGNDQIHSRFSVNDKWSLFT